MVQTLCEPGGLENGRGTAFPTPLSEIEALTHGLVNPLYEMLPTVILERIGHAIGRKLLKREERIELTTRLPQISKADRLNAFRRTYCVFGKPLVDLDPIRG